MGAMKKTKEKEKCIGSEKISLILELCCANALSKVELWTFLQVILSQIHFSIDHYKNMYVFPSISLQ